MAHKKGRQFPNGRDSISQYLGVKITRARKILRRTIIVRQPGQDPSRRERGKVG